MACSYTRASQEFVDLRQLENFCTRDPTSSSVKLAMSIHGQNVLSVPGSMELLQMPGREQGDVL